ncbi:hypothetical protein K458DRAFT_367203 [Lentithecium fluviatile CBS 122367]|uniref:Cyclin N-terminal domain-containing protein n=1 Tax=Lentithecium fluviatile CBS 122367 TaxID=1168545 RepID=A0A6G1J138_9PLEO|nr:hypothetical protein K458DRAFT_367203 [Lentithecium fluviatile CBS 122367]
MEYSPAMSTRSDFSDMDDEALELYLASCVPLSNLPTPPPAKEQHPLLPTSLPTPPLDASEFHHAPELEVYATHLANLVPRNVSSRTPDVAVIQGLLGRAGLPVDVVAFAGCVLDALSSRFGGAWREVCGGADSSLHSFSFGYDIWHRSTASPSPDLIVLSALALAYGFMDDRGRSNSHWARIEAAGRFEAKDVEATKMCILRDTDYGLFRISDAMVRKRCRDLQRACDFAVPGWRPKLALSTGTGALGVAVWVNGVQTPEPSP